MRCTFNTHWVHTSLCPIDVIPPLSGVDNNDGAKVLPLNMCTVCCQLLICFFYSFPPDPRWLHPVVLDGPFSPAADSQTKFVTRSPNVYISDRATLSRECQILSNSVIYPKVGRMLDEHVCF